MPGAPWRARRPRSQTGPKGVQLRQLPNPGEFKLLLLGHLRVFAG